MRTFRVATLNIWQRFGPWEERLPALRKGIAALGADVMGLQEVLRHDGFDQAALVAPTGYEIAWGIASPNHGYPLGNAILSRWPIGRTETFALPDGGTDERRSLVYAEIAAPFGKLPFFVTHLNWKPWEGHVRVAQVKAVVEHVTRLAPEGSFPPVLVGDFNAEPDSDEVRYLRGLTGLGGPCVYFADAFGVAGDGVDRDDVLQAEPARRAAARAGAAHRLRVRSRAGRRAAGRAARGAGVLRRGDRRHVRDRSLRRRHDGHRRALKPR